VRVSISGHSDFDAGKFPEVRAHVGGEHHPVGGAAGSGHDQIVGTARPAGAGRVGQKLGLMFGDTAVVLAHRNHRKHIFKKRPLRGLVAHIGTQVHASQKLSYRDSRNRNVGIARKQDPPAYRSDKHTGIED